MIEGHTWMFLIEGDGDSQDLFYPGLHHVGQWLHSLTGNREGEEESDSTKP